MMRKIARALTPMFIYDHIKRRRASHEFDIKIPKSVVKEVLARHSPDSPWFYASFEYQHNSTDVLAAALLGYIRDNVRRDAKIFESGCGCGWFLIGLAQLGFTNLSGSDILGEAIEAGKEFSTYTGYPMELWQDNGFKPAKIPNQMDVFIATQWLYSAWAGNYSEENKGLSQRDPVELLREVFVAYTGHMAQGGLFIISLVDSIANLRPDDPGTYPVRHSYDDVMKCLNEFGYVLKKRFFDRGDCQPRMVYIASKL